ncbi:DUF2637 domain-containing protein [Nonomuraea sp. NPDC050733]
MHELALKHGEDEIAAALIPLAVDGTIVVASMSLLLASRPAAVAAHCHGSCSSSAVSPALEPTLPSRSPRSSPA